MKRGSPAGGAGEREWARVRGPPPAPGLLRLETWQWARGGRGGPPNGQRPVLERYHRPGRRSEGKCAEEAKHPRSSGHAHEENSIRIPARQLKRPAEGVVAPPLPPPAGRAVAGPARLASPPQADLRAGGDSGERWTHARTDGWVDGWMDGWMHGWT
eukprot:scaffold1371_cov400-Prasinococcus_capsulatus_cf.AAC.11